MAGAIAAYTAACACAGSTPSHRLALAELTHLGGDADSAQRHFVAAFATTRVFSPAAAAPGARDVLVLLQPGPWPQNIPLDFIVDRARFTLHKWYLHAEADADAEHLPRYDAVVVAIGAAERAAAALAYARRFVAERGAVPLNDPACIAGTSRPALAATLAGIAGCSVAAAARVDAARLRDLPEDAAAVAGIAFPLLVRPVDGHGGRDLVLAADAAAVRAHVAAAGAAAYDVSAFVPYAGPDGFYRKYRVMFVDGAAFPYHAALDERWMIHYHRAPMAEHAWMRAEEERFLRDPGAVFPGWTTTMPAIAAALGLDYAGIDCTRLADGSVLVFEADAAMLVHGNDPPGRFGYKRPAFDRIAAAFGALLERRCNFSKPQRD